MICYNKAGKYQEELGKGEEEASEHERDDRTDFAFMGNWERTIITNISYSMGS